jgi:hypothetical protein
MVYIIRYVDLDDRLVYKILSYVWGDANNTLPILVDEKLYYMTVNYYTMLRRLRGTEERYIWINVDHLYNRFIQKTRIDAVS